MRIILLMLLAAITNVTSAQNWLITGNTGNTNSNFLGNIDNKSIIFKTNSIERGRLQNNGIWRFGPPGNTTTIDSTGKLLFSGTGFYQLAQNSYVFRLANKPNYGMFFNSAIANYELRDSLAASVFFCKCNSGHVTVKGRLQPNVSNTSSLGTATNGWKDLFLNGSIFNGSAKIFNVDILNGNTATGQTALPGNTGFDNTANGQAALRSNTSGFGNTANGVTALFENSTGSSNTATGQSALFNNTTGSENTANGLRASRTTPLAFQM